VYDPVVIAESLLRWVCACAVCAGLLSCSSSAPKPAATIATPATRPPPPEQLSAYERRWQSACEAHGTIGQCPAPFDRPGLFFDIENENEQPPPSLCGAGDATIDAAARPALHARRRALQACFRGAERGAFVDIEHGGARRPSTSPGLSARTLSCVAKIVESELPGTTPDAALRVVVMNGGSARTGEATLSNEGVHATIAAHADEVSACYDGALEVWPGLRGRLAPTVVIWFDGSVALVRTKESSLDSPALECCINTAVRGWRFDPPAEGTIAIVVLPLVLGPQEP
jgi:hypothetical protein